MTLTVVLALVGAGISAGSYLAGWWVARSVYRLADHEPVEIVWHEGVLSVPAADVQLFADDRGIVRFVERGPKPERPEPSTFDRDGTTWTSDTSSEPLRVQIFADQRPRPIHAGQPIQPVGQSEPIQS